MTAAEPDANEDLTPTAAAAIAGCSERSMLRYVERGLLAGRRIVGTRKILIRRTDLQRFLEGVPIVSAAPTA